MFFGGFGTARDPNSLAIKRKRRWDILKARKLAGEPSSSTIKTKNKGRVSPPKTPIPVLALERVYKRKSGRGIRAEMPSPPQKAEPTETSHASEQNPVSQTPEFAGEAPSKTGEDNTAREEREKEPTLAELYGFRRPHTRPVNKL